MISLAPAFPVPDRRCPEKLIRISGLEKRYSARQGGAVNALEDVTLDIVKGELISIVGPSGCGKSSLMRLIAGLEAPTSGLITVGGTSVKGTRNDIGIVFQQATLLPWQTVLDNVLLPAIFAGLEVAAVFAVIGALVGEFVGTQEGFGYLITTYNFNIDIPGVFAVLIILSVLGMALHAQVRWIGRRMVFWIHDERAVTIGS